MPEQGLIKSIINSICCGGNRCGHDKNNPFLSLTIESTNRPSFLYSVAKAFRKYYHDPDLFPSLKHAHTKNRQQRTERRESVVVVMLAILEFLDIASLRVGIPSEGGFQPLKLDVLRRRTNLSTRRFERAIQSLRKSGILKGADQLKIKTLSGEYKYFPVVRRINKAFFVVLGFGEKLPHEMKEASKRLAERARRLGTTVAKMAHFSLQTAARQYNKWRKERQDKIEKSKGKKGKRITDEEIRSFLSAYHAPREVELHMQNLTHRNGKSPPPFPPGGAKQ